MKPSLSSASAIGYILGEYVSSIDDSPQPFALWVPRSYTPKRSWPIIVALHGSDADHRMIPEGCFQIPKRGFDERAILLSPFGRGDVDWRWMGEADVWDAMALVRARYRIDARRQYLTGLSMGGYAAWRLAVEHSGQWAAIAPVCGGGDLAAMAKLKRTPVWCVHGERDPIVPVQRSRELVDELRRLKGRVRYDELSGWGHESWKWLYDPERRGDSLTDWLLQFQKPSPAKPMLRPERSGCFNDLFDERIIICHPEKTPIAREAEQLRAEAERIARFHCGDLVMRSGRLLVKSDAELTEAEAKQSNLLMLGRTDNHSWLRRIERRLPARHIENRLVLQGETLLGKNWATATVQPNPWNKKRLLGVITYQQRGQIAGLAAKFITHPKTSWASMLDTRTGQMFCR